jgi:tetratricopeptide (TPR) repeat protein
MRGRRFVQRTRECHNSLGQYEQALEYYQKDLDITIKISVQHCPDVAALLCLPPKVNIGLVFNAMGIYC